VKGKDSKRDDNRPAVYRGRRLAFEVLNRVLLGSGYSNVLLSARLDRENLAAEDKQAAVNLVYGVLRNLTLIDEVFRSKSDKGKIELSPTVLNLGRMAIYEMLFMQSIPYYATGSEFMKMARKEGSAGEAGFLNACLRKIEREDRDRLVKRERDPIARMALRYSHPEWFARVLTEFYGVDDARNILRSNNNPQPVYFRANTCRVSVEELLSSLEYHHHDIQPLGSPPYCLMLPYGKGMFPKKEYESGWLTPQDRSAQFIAFYLDPKPDDRVLDLCCGSGIKTGQIMELMQGKGEIVAVDMFAHKLENIKSEFRRLGFNEIKTVVEDIERRPSLGSFDKVILDVPCTGTGTVRHRPEIKYRVKQEDVVAISGKQERLLEAAASYVAPGGILVYSTCSLLPDENEERIGAFLDSRSDFIHITQEIEAVLPFSVIHFHRGRWGTTFLPVTVNGCGSFVSVLRRAV